MSQRRKPAKISKKNAVEPLVSKSGSASNFFSVPILFAAAVFSGTLGNATFGVINQADPGCSHLVTLLQQIFTLILTWKKGEHIWKRPTASEKGVNKHGMQIPIGWHLAVTLCLIGGSFLGNLALDLKLPLPLYFLIKCGNLVASMCVGLIFLKRSYSYDQVLSVVLVTLGLCHSVINAHGESTFTTLDFASMSIFLGSLSVFLALVSTSFLGAVQEVIFTRYRDHFDEVTFVTTVMFIPLYVMLNFNSITLHLVYWLKGGWAKVIIPLIVNASSAHICRLTMFQITGASSQGALTSMYAATIYRFSAILVSSWVSDTPAQSGMWIGVALVFVGTLISFASEGVPAKKRPAPPPPSSSSLMLRKSQLKKNDYLHNRKEFKLVHAKTHAKTHVNNNHGGGSSGVMTEKPEMRKVGSGRLENNGAGGRGGKELVSRGKGGKGGRGNSPSKNKHKSPTKHKGLSRRASAPKLTQLEMQEIEMEGFDVRLERALSVETSMSPSSVMRLRKSSSLHSDLDLMHNIRYSV